VSSPDVHCSLKRMYIMCELEVLELITLRVRVHWNLCRWHLTIY